MTIQLTVNTLELSICSSSGDSVDPNLYAAAISSRDLSASVHQAACIASGLPSDRLDEVRMVERNNLDRDHSHETRGFEGLRRIRKRQLAILRQQRPAARAERPSGIWCVGLSIDLGGRIHRLARGSDLACDATR